MVKLCWLCLLLLGTAYEYQPTLASKELDQDLNYLPENFSIDSLQNPVIRNRFRPLTSAVKLNNGWVHFKVNNPTTESQSVIIEIQNTNFFDLIELFEYADGKFSSLGISGEQVPHFKRPMKDHYFVFPVRLNPQSSQEYYLYLKSPFAFHPSVAIHSSVWYSRKNEQNRLLYVFHYGFLFFVMALSLVIALVFAREKIFLYYALYLFCILLFFYSPHRFWIGFSVAELAGV